MEDINDSTSVSANLATNAENDCTVQSCPVKIKNTTTSAQTGLNPSNPNTIPTSMLPQSFSMCVPAQIQIFPDGSPQSYSSNVLPIVSIYQSQNNELTNGVASLSQKEGTLSQLNKTNNNSSTCHPVTTTFIQPNYHMNSLGNGIKSNMLQGPTSVPLQMPISFPMALTSSLGLPSGGVYHQQYQPFNNLMNLSAKYVYGQLSESIFEGISLRRGKWTTEEEQYASLLIDEFEKGVLRDCENGCTLRAYLSKKLHCAPMRISKKFAGKSIGKHVYLGNNAVPQNVTEPLYKTKMSEYEQNFFHVVLQENHIPCASAMPFSGLYMYPCSSPFSVLNQNPDLTAQPPKQLSNEIFLSTNQSMVTSKPVEHLKPDINNLEHTGSNANKNNNSKAGLTGMNKGVPVTSECTPGISSKFKSSLTLQETSEGYSVKKVQKEGPPEVSAYGQVNQPSRDQYFTSPFEVLTSPYKSKILWNLESSSDCDNESWSVSPDPQENDPLDFLLQHTGVSNLTVPQNVGHQKSVCDSQSSHKKIKLSPEAYTLFAQQSVMAVSQHSAYCRNNLYQTNFPIKSDTIKYFKNEKDNVVETDSKETSTSSKACDDDVNVNAVEPTRFTEVTDTVRCEQHPALVMDDGSFANLRPPIQDCNNFNTVESSLINNANCSTTRKTKRTIGNASVVSSGSEESKPDVII